MGIWLLSQVKIGKKIYDNIVLLNIIICSNGATDCDDWTSGIAQACNSEDLDFCEMDGCCDNMNSTCPYF